MQFGYFDDKRKEYVVTQPDTPRSWSNYLGSTEYGAIITNNAGGYSFLKSAAQGRFTRLRFNAVPMDQPGRYIYIHDRDNKDYWSASWQPVGKPLDEYQTECRHGTAYTIISSRYRGIETATTYFVPLNRHFECWWLKAKNTGDKPRKLRFFTYVEYANNWDLTQDLVNLQFTQYTVNMDVVNGIIDHGTNTSMPPNPDDFEDDGQGRHTFLGIAGAEVSGYDTDRETFLGPYRTYANPIAAESGACRQSKATGDNACGVLQFDLELHPGEEREVVVIMGIGAASEEGRQVLAEFSDISKIRMEFDAVKAYWHSKLEHLEAKTPDPEFNSLFNVWNPYNCLITYAWSRAASLVYNGERDGLGYRDTLQDMLGCLHIIPEDLVKRLELMITGQVSTGGAMPVVKPFAHSPGKEAPPHETEYRSDDCMWLFNTIPGYVKESGDLAFFDKVLPYADKGQDTVLGHMRRAIEFNLERSGKHGLPCGLHADWNDCLLLGHEGESVFVAFQLRFALKTYIEICEMKSLQHEAEWALQHLEKLDENIAKHTWDGEWYLRAFRFDGLKFGTHESPEASIFLNTQSWAILSGHVDSERAVKIMDAVKNHLATEHGIMICTPPVTTMDPAIIRARLFNPGMKENGAIFCHTQGWAVIAETLLGHGNQAYEYYRAYMPSAYNSHAEIREVEPYVYCQSTHSKYSPRFGASRVPWLTGAATWAYQAASQYILGIRPEYTGLRIDPCIPNNWKEIKVQRLFRNKRFRIHTQNPDGVEKGVRSITLNGKVLPDSLIPIEDCVAENEVIVTMG